MAKGKQMKVLEDRLELVRRELEKLKAQESLLLDMIRVESGEPKAKTRAPRSNVKQTVLDLLAEHLESGLNATIAIEIAKDRGVSLDRGSVSSLLSRMKNDGIVSYDGSVYRLPKSGGSPPANIHHIRTSGAGM